MSMTIHNCNPNLTILDREVKCDGVNDVTAILECVKEIRHQRGLRSPIRVYFHTCEFRLWVCEYNFTAIDDFKMWLDNEVCGGMYGFSRAEFDYDCGKVKVSLHQ